MITLFVGAQPGTIQGERDTLQGNRMFTASRSPRKNTFDNVVDIYAYLDSGAFSDSPQDRLTPEGALNRQLTFEQRASAKWGGNWTARAFVSYDLLIDEVWSNGKRHKRRWSIADADIAVLKTIEAAKYLVSQRQILAPRKVILSAQGVDAIQYRECMQEILAIAEPDDIIGFGGWCILGRYKSWLPEFWQTLWTCLPLIAQNNNKDIHIFGVLYQPALGGLLWLADHYGLQVSTDSSAPIKSAACTTEAKRKKAGVRCTSGYWRDNVDWWINTLASLQQSEYYRKPPNSTMVRQLTLW